MNLSSNFLGLQRLSSQFFDDCLGTNEEVNIKKFFLIERKKIYTEKAHKFNN